MTSRPEEQGSVTISEWRIIHVRCNGVGAGLLFGERHMELYLVSLCESINNLFNPLLEQLQMLV